MLPCAPRDTFRETQPPSAHRSTTANRSLEPANETDRRHRSIGARSVRSQRALPIAARGSVSNQHLLRSPLVDVDKESPPTTMPSPADPVGASQGTAHGSQSVS